VLLELSDEGLLQSAPGWLGWTGMARTAGGHARGVRVVIDDAGPNGRRTIVEVDGDGGSLR
jgi:hypothetical protein